MKKVFFCLLMENKPGALARVVGVISARGWNIYSLSVAPTKYDPSRSQAKIAVEMGLVEVDEVQILKQLKKLVNVLRVDILEPE